MLHDLVNPQMQKNLGYEGPTIDYSWIHPYVVQGSIVLKSATLIVNL